MKRILLTGALFTAGLGVYGEANAYCTLSSGFTTVDISMAVGRVVVRPSDPVGKILTKATFLLILMVLHYGVLRIVTLLQLR